jgi:hypothetical protein
MARNKEIVFLKDTSHDFNKTNLVTLPRGYDTYACKCGAKGKRHGLSDAIELIKGKPTCPDAKPKVASTTKRVRITSFTGNNPRVFGNLTKGSEHDIVPCPEAEKHKFADDVWVMGIGEPVRLLGGEYTEI